MNPRAAQAAKLTTAEFVQQCRETVIPLAGSLGYFSLLPLDESEYDRLVHYPTSAFPPRLQEIIPNLRLILVPYLVSDPPAPDRASEDGSVFIEFRPRPEAVSRLATFETRESETYLFLAVRDEAVSDAHVILYHELADRLVSLATEDFCAAFAKLVNGELKKNVRGELEEDAWQLKKELLSYQGDAEGKSALLDRYHRLALRDSLALYLHGLCCDIDLHTGPKQLPSSAIRSRLVLLKKQMPPPEGVALFPEEVSAK